MNWGVPYHDLDQRPQQVERQQVEGDVDHAVVNKVACDRAARPRRAAARGPSGRRTGGRRRCPGRGTATGSETVRSRIQRQTIATNTTIQVRREEGRRRIVPDFPGDGAKRHAGSRQGWSWLRCGRRGLDRARGSSPASFAVPRLRGQDWTELPSRPLAAAGRSTGRSPRWRAASREHPALAAKLFGGRLSVQGGSRRYTRTPSTQRPGCRYSNRLRIVSSVQT